MSTVTAQHATQTPPSLLGHPIRWLQSARQRRRSRQLDDAFADARIALGRRMYAAGIDDDETGAKIAEVDRALAAVPQSSGEAQDLWGRRTLLYIQLADA